MKKHGIKVIVILASVLLIAAAVFLAAFCYDAAKFNPNRDSVGNSAASYKADQLTQLFIPMYDSVEVHFVEKKAMFRNDYIVNARVRKHERKGDGYVYADYTGEINNGKCRENSLDWYFRQGTARTEWFTDGAADASEERWQELFEIDEEENVFAFFKVNGSFRLDVIATDFYLALNGEGEYREPPEIEWAGKALCGTDFMLGTPLGRRIRKTEGLSDPQVWVFAKTLAQHNESAMTRWLLDSGLFGDFSTADFDQFLSEPFLMDAVMIHGTKSVIERYKENPILTLTYFKARAL